MDPGSALRAAGMTSEREAVPHILSAVTPGKAQPRPGAYWLPERRRWYAALPIKDTSQDRTTNDASCLPRVPMDPGSALRAAGMTAEEEARRKAAGLWR